MRVPVRVAVWTFHLALPLLGLWLLVERPQYDGHWEHHQAHFWLVLLTALVNVGVGAVIGEAARRHDDARLFLVSLAFLVAAGFLALHATATPGVILAKNAGFVVATPIGLLLASGLALASSIDFSERGAARVLRLQGLLRFLVALLLVGWGAWSLLDLPPLDRVLAPSEAHGPLVGLAVVGGACFLVAAIRYQIAYRRTPSVVRLSLVTSFVLLAESMVSMAWGRNWQASWWEWHVLMTLAFGYVAYGAYVQYRREGTAAGLFDAVALPATVARLRKEYGDALDVLVDAMESGVAPRRAAEQAGARFALTERQVDVLARAGEALAAERDLLRRQAAVVAVGQASSVILLEDELVQQAQALVDDAFGPDVRIVVGRTEGHAGVPLMVKGHEVGAVVAADRVASARDRLLLESLAAQVATGIENARLYQQMDTLFRSYISPEVATALVADPSQAALGGETREVTVLMADLKGFTPFSERSEPGQVVAMLNRYYGVAVPIVLAEGGTVVQFVGDALMALFNAPVVQADHAVRAGRAGLAMQAAVTKVADEHPGWPRFRVGINSGPALVGNIGAAAMRNFTAIGDTTNLAARLEAAAGAGQVVVGATTAALLGPGARLESMGLLDVKGKAEPVEAFVLLAVDG